MALNPPLKTLDISLASSGFYRGFNNTVALASKIIIALIVVWAVINPESAGKILGDMKNWSFAHLNYYYTWSVAFFILVCLLIALVPKWGSTKLGDPDGKPEFSNFSWFSMMFGAGIGIGMLGYATGEPMWHMGDNPDIRLSVEAIGAALSSANITLAEWADIWAEYRAQVTAGTVTAIDGLIEPKTASSIDSVYRYSFLHWGFGAWSCYALVGISLAFFSYSRGLPLTIRSTLTPLFGRSLEGPIGHIVDITAVVATILGIAQTGLGLASFSSGLYNITGAEWLIADGEPSTGSLLVALAVVMMCSTLSALSGGGKGIKWLSNLNMVLSFGLLTFFLIFGSTMFALTILGKGTFSYLINLPAMTLNVFPTTGAGTPGEWQGWWSIFYWAWWIAFAPFVGIFLARISKNRTIREFALGAIVAPSLMCFLWFSLLGGTAIDLELSGVAEGKIFAKSLTAQLYEVINIMLSSGMATVMSVLIVILLLTYLVTSADSAVLVVNTINAGGEAGAAGKSHIIIWGLILTAVIAALLLAGGLDAIQAAMIIGAIPFSFMMILMGLSLIKALIRDGIRDSQTEVAYAK